MGDKKFTRRHFFRSLTNTPNTDIETDDNNDPLFKKYSRKKGGSRSYSTELVEIKPGTEDVGNPVARVGNPVVSGLAPYSGTWTENEVLHLLRRTNFGWKKAWVDALLPLTPSAAVDAVLNISTTPPAPPINWYQNIANEADESSLAGNNNANDNPVIGYGADWTNHYFPASATGQSTNENRFEGLRRWLFGLTLNGDHTIREKMVWFWYHFIPIDFQVIYQSSNSYVHNNTARIFYRYFKMFRDNALGNYKTLIRQVATDPCMTYYLNNQANTKTAPDENFARELMELFTIGKDNPNNSFDDQLDVIEGAKVLTGWRVQNMNTANPTTAFVSSVHHTGTKTFSSFFNTTINYQSGAAGANELDALVNMIFSKSTHVSQYICRRLYRYFVYYDIDANIEANIIVPLAQAFVANNWNIKPVLEQLFKSQHFYDMANRGCYIKTPFDLVAGTLNSFGVNTGDANIEWQYRIWSRYNDSYCLSMEQRMGSIPNVSGWNAFYQTPAYHQYWINSNAVQKRFIFIRDIFNGHTIGASSGVITVTVNGITSNRSFKVDPIAFAQMFGNNTTAQPTNPTDPSDPNKLVAVCIKWLLTLDLSQVQKDSLKASTLLSGQTTDSYWTTAWLAYQGNPNTANRNVVEPRLRNLLSGICQLAEYQLM
jgi:uncharacterized protein (DUF1800 family)